MEPNPGPPSSSFAKLPSRLNFSIRLLFVSATHRATTSPAAFSWGATPPGLEIWPTRPPLGMGRTVIR